MIQQVWDASNKKFCLYVSIKSTTKRTFRVVAADSGKVNSKYADRNIEVEGERDIYLSFPVSPKQLIITVMDVKNPTATDFEVSFKEGRIRDSAVWLDDDTRSFVQMAIIFSQVCGFTNPPADSFKAYQSSDGLYNLKYFNVIKDVKTGSAMSTPARIGHSTGTIEVSKIRFDKYTIPMRMIILLHEFSHKYKNPVQGREIGDETGADLNALYIYLGMGFSKVDAIYVFVNVFLKAQTEENIKRMRTIMKYIKDFEEKQANPLIFVAA